MEEFANEIKTMLNVDTVFEIPIFGGIEIFESVVVSWIVMAVMLIATLLLTRDLKVENPGKRQVFVEFCVTSLQKIVKGIVGEEGQRYAQYLATVLVFIGISNTIGLFGFKAPTKDLNVTAALALISIILIEYAGIHAKGAKKWLKSFAEPVAIITPLNVLEIFIKPLSLCMRLFGNVLGAFVIMELIKLVVPVVLPAAFSLYFDIFDGLIQAYVFVFLTGLFIKEAVE